MFQVNIVVGEKKNVKRLTIVDTLFYNHAKKMEKERCKANGISRHVMNLVSVTYF